MPCLPVKTQGEGIQVPEIGKYFGKKEESD